MKTARVRVGTAKFPPTSAEETRIRRLAKRCGLVFRKARGKGATYSIIGPRQQFFSVSLRSIERKIEAVAAGQKAKRRWK